MSRPIRGFLADFTPVAQPADLPCADPAAVLDATALATARAQVALDAARAEGLAEGRGLAEAAAAARLHVLAAEHAEALETARARWAVLEGQELAASLRAGLASLETTLAESLAAAVLPFVEPALRHRTTLELRQGLAALMAGQHGALVEIRGPGDLVEPLRAAWEADPAVVVTASDAAEVIIEAADTTIRSQLRAWSERFEKALLPA